MFPERCFGHRRSAFNVAVSFLFAAGFSVATVGSVFEIKD